MSLFQNMEQVKDEGLQIVSVLPVAVRDIWRDYKSLICMGAAMAAVQIAGQIAIGITSNEPFEPIETGILFFGGACLSRASHIIAQRSDSHLTNG